LKEGKLYYPFLLLHFAVIMLNLQGHSGKIFLISRGFEIAMNWKRLHPASLLRMASCVALAALGLLLVPNVVAPVSAATLGTVVPIGGAAADIALDEPRGVLYIANFTANRIDVMSLADNTVHTSYNVAGQPASLSLSPDG